MRRLVRLSLPGLVRPAQGPGNLAAVIHDKEEERSASKARPTLSTHGISAKPGNKLVIRPFLPLTIPPGGEDDESAL